MVIIYSEFLHFALALGVFNTINKEVVKNMLELLDFHSEELLA